MHLLSTWVRIAIGLVILINYFQFTSLTHSSSIILMANDITCQSDGVMINLSGNDTICTGEQVGIFSVQFNGSDPNLIKPVYTKFRINEIEVDNAGTDTAEFIEILGPPDSSLNGFVLVFFNGNAISPANASYRIIDLDRFRTDTGGYFLIRGPGIPDPHPTTNVSDTLVNVNGGFIQNGQDAVALYRKPTYTNNTSPVITDLTDVIVYHNANGNIDTNLLVSLNATEQFADNQVSVLARIPNGTGNFVKDSTPTPGHTNSNDPLYHYLWLFTEVDSIIDVHAGANAAGYPTTFVVTIAGNYQVYGLSIMEGLDSFKQRSFHKLDQLESAIQNGYCATLSSQSIRLVCLPPFNLIELQIGECSTFDSSGSYQIHIQWTGPIVVPKLGPDYNNSLPGQTSQVGDTFKFTSNPIKGGDTILLRFIDPFCGDTIYRSIFQFCDYCSLMHEPDSLPPMGICASEPYLILPQGGGVEELRPTDDLFFSEYIEGSANNKCLEIYNGTGFDIDLAAESYSVEIYFNGQTIPLGIVNLNNNIGAGETFVICHNLADTTFRNRAQQVSGNMDFNGDDAIVLKHHGHIIDVIGQIGFDPGSQWGSGLASTQDNTIIRKSLIYEGDTSATNVFLPSTEWIGFTQNERSNLGRHNYTAIINVTTGYRFYNSFIASARSYLGQGLSYSQRLIPGSSDTIYYSAINENYGCESGLRSVIINSSLGLLNCINQVNITLTSKDCTKTLQSSDVVKNPGYCNFRIELSYPFGTKFYSSKNILDRSHLNQPILYQAHSSDNSCWGYVWAKDQLSILGNCLNDTINCFEWYYQQEEALNFIDPCSGISGLVQQLRFEDSLCESEFTGVWTRTQIRSDFKSMSRVCTDTLWIIKSKLMEIIEPESIRVDCDQLRGYTPDLLIPDSLLSYQKMGILSEDFHLIPRIDDLNIYPYPGPGCNLNTSYTDLILPLCGSGFIIRREWKIIDWCTLKDTLFVQNIRIEDFKAPRPSSVKPILEATTDPHTCYGTIRRVRPLRFNDCSELITSVAFYYEDPINPGRIINIETENLSTLILPRGKHLVTFKASDGCGFYSTGVVEATIVDHSTPEVTCHTNVNLTVDPVNCWSRIYAIDLDNGSKDNCQQQLHFAIACSDSIVYWENYWSKQLESLAGQSFFQKNTQYKSLIEQWINTYLFNDFIDLGSGQFKSILRVYEADSIPLYDPHLFPGNHHEWYCYNTYPLSRMEMNYRFSMDKKWNNSKPVLHSLDSLIIKYSPSDFFEPLIGLFNGSREHTVCEFNPLFTIPEPGYLCENALFQDCTSTLNILDKTPPVGEMPNDLFVFCDGAQFEFADELCSSQPDLFSIRDFDCRDINQRPYHEIECLLEHDGELSDAIDPRGISFGYYGCNKLDKLLLDESGPHYQTCNESDWKPAYCHRWLCQDHFDQRTDQDFTSLFWHPEFSPIQDEIATPVNSFLVRDNCRLDTPAISVTDTSFLGDCGKGWLQRVWTFRDHNHNELKRSQKIIVNHRSDFEVVFPKDTTLTLTGTPGSQIQVLEYPMIDDADCESYGISYEDQAFDLSMDSGFKVIRTWTIQDWCLFSAIEPGKHQMDIIVDDRWIADPVKRPCTYRYLKDGGDGQIKYNQVIFVRSQKNPAYVKSNLIWKNEELQHSPLGPVIQNQLINPTSDHFKLFQNQPNPFSNETWIYFKTTGDEPFNFEIRDLNGKVILKKVFPKQHGIQSMRLFRSEFHTAGIYFYSLCQGKYQATRKLMVIN